MKANSKTNPIYSHVFTASQEALDQNGHINNVHYVQWMQDIAIRHYESIGGIPPTHAIGATWVVHTHHIEYLSPAFADDEIEVRTWVVNIRRVRSLRRYEFIRKIDGILPGQVTEPDVIILGSTGVGVIECKLSERDKPPSHLWEGSENSVKKRLPRYLEAEPRLLQKDISEVGVAKVYQLVRMAFYALQLGRRFSCTPMVISLATIRTGI